MMNIKAVADAMLPRLPDLVVKLFPAGKRVGDEYVVGNLAGDPGQSLSINLRNGKWADFAEDVSGGDAVSLWAKAKGCSNGTAARELVAEFGLTQASRQLQPEKWRRRANAKKAKANGEDHAETVIMPVPASAGLPPPAEGIGTPAGLWEYCDAKGGLLLVVRRYDKPSTKPNGKVDKEFRPSCYTSKGWRMMHAPEPRPLYGLQPLAERPDAPVLVVEGEKKCEAARLRLPDYVVVSWCGGAQSVAKADWSPLQGRQVTVWPDADKVGPEAAAKVARRALAAGAAEARVVQLPDGLPDGWDLADEIPDGLSIADLLAEAEEPEPATEAKPTVAGKPQQLGCSDTANGYRLKARHGENLLYCKPWDRWLIWDGIRWAWDQRLQIDLLCKDVARGIYDECKDAKSPEAQKALAKWARASQDIRGLRNMAAAAMSELPAMPDVFDVDPWLLNVLNGTIDLRTGELRPHRREDRITMLAPVVYDPEAKAPRWDRFIEEIMAPANDPAAMAAYLRRVAGYALTGIIDEHCLFLLYGHGRNGKSTYVRTLHAMLGDFAARTETKTLLNKRDDSVSNDLAALRKVRLALAVEVGKGRQLNEPLIKEATGGDPVTCRFLFKEFFTYSPEFKLMLAVNDKPKIEGTDDGIWSRPRLVPFLRKFEGAGDEKGLGDKIKGTELPGVLAWAVRGCREWQQGGLQDPAEVLAATQAYRRESDVLGGFLDAACVQDIKASITVGKFHEVYTSWCRDNGEQPVSGNELGKEMAKRGITSKEKWLAGRTQRVYGGIGLVADKGQF